MITRRLAATIVVAMIAFAGCGSSSSSSSSGERSTEQKLSALFGGDTDAIGDALDRAASNCPETRDLIADYVTFTIQELNEKMPNHGENAVTIASAIAEAADAASAEMKCSEVAATLLVLMLPSG